MTTIPFKTLSSQDNLPGRLRSGWPVLWDHLKARQKVFLITYVVLTLTGLVLVVLIPSHYRTEAVVQALGADGMPRKLTVLEEQSYRKTVMSSAVLELATHSIHSGRGGEPVPRQARDRELVESVEAAARSSAGTDLTDANRYQTVRELTHTISVSVDSAKGWVLISAQSGKPEQAAFHANLVAEAFVETERKHVEVQRKQYQPELAERDRLSELLSEHQKSYEKAGSDLAIFDEESRSTYGNSDLAAARTDLERTVSRARTELELANTRIESLSVSLGHLVKELDATPEFLELPEVTIGPNPARVALVAEIAQHERELSVMLRRYTERHPLVIEKYNIIEQKKQDLAKMERRVSDTETRAKQPNPLYLQANQNVSQAKIKLQEARLKAREQETSLKSAAADLTGLVPRPAKRRELLAEVTRSKSELDRISIQLVRTEQGLTSLEATLVVPKLVERAPTPTQPSGPDRDWWTLVVFLTAVLGAVGTAFGIHVLDSSYASAWEVERDLKLPVLAKVSHVDVRLGRRPACPPRRIGRRVVAGGLTVVLLLAGVVVVVLLFVFDAQIHVLRMFLFGN